MLWSGAVEARLVSVLPRTDAHCHSANLSPLGDLLFLGVPICMTLIAQNTTQGLHVVLS